VTRRVWLQSLLVVIWPRTTIARTGATAIQGATMARSADSPLLSEREVETLLAFAEAIVGGRPLSPAARSDLAAHVRESAESEPEQRAVYRRAAGSLDCLATGRFSALSLSDRAALIARHRLAGAGAASDGTAERCPETAEIRSRVLPDLVAAYWRSPAGWAVVGYAAFPGRCSDLTRYTQREP
jgi:hypothetical protein